MSCEEYQKNGYLLRHDFFSEADLVRIEPILQLFHEQWMGKNREHYQSQAINSAYITRRHATPDDARQTLFDFISCNKMIEIANSLISGEPAFMNTQLFFNPENPDQKNYWHRDIQYVPYSIDRQKERLASSTVLHFRAAMVDEPGIELVPGTHKRWDTAQEFETRTGANNRMPHDALPDGKAIPLKRGDLLVFSANMIHRGLYGGDRFAFDIIFSDADPELLQFVEEDCLPDTQEMQTLEHPEIFAATWAALAGNNKPGKTT